MVPEPGLTPGGGSEPVSNRPVPHDHSAVPPVGSPLPPPPPASWEDSTAGTPGWPGGDPWRVPGAYPPPPPPPAVQPWTSAPFPAADGAFGSSFAPPPPPGYLPGAGQAGIAASTSALPVEPREYHQFYRAPRFRWWKPLAAIGAFVVAWFLAAVPPVVIALGWDLSHNGGKLDPNAIDLNTPAMFLGNNVSIAVAIIAAVLVSWMVYRQRPRWLSSIEGGFRWRIFWRFLGIAFLGMAVAWAVEAALGGGVGDLTITPATWVLLVGIVITTPFQAAGEEYAMRGLVFRSIASWFPNRWVGLVVGLIVNAVAFMFLHAAGDVWLNVYYFFVGAVFSILVWRTGGLEAAIAMHIANNLISEMLLPFQPDAFSHLFDRQAGVAGPEILIQLGVTALVAAALLWQSSRLKVSRATAPAAAVE